MAAGGSGRDCGDMFLITVRMRRVDSTAVDSVDRVREAVTAAASPSERLEHVFAQHEGVDLSIVLFLLSPDLVRAEATATALVARARNNGLAGWEPVTCQAELITPFTEAALKWDS